MKKEQWKSAAEVIAELNADPKWVRANEEREKQRRERSEINRREMSPILDELALVGVRIPSLSSSSLASGAYEHAIPILLSHLSRPYGADTRSTLARALGRKEAADYFDEIVNLYTKETEESTKTGLAESLMKLVSHSQLQRMEELLSDKSNGDSRLLLLLGVAKFKTKDAGEMLKKFEGDEVLHREVKSLDKATG